MGLALAGLVFPTRGHMPEASPFWQNAFLVWVIVCIGWSMWSGWRTGVVRAAISLGGMFVAYFAGVAVAAVVPALIGWLIPLPGALVGGVCGSIAGVLVYVVLWFLGALLFKRTAQQATAPLRLIYGAGGALLGAVFGVFVVWAVMLFVRGVGGFLEARFEPGVSDVPKSNAVITSIVKLKRSIEAGDTGKLLESFDPMPESFYRIVDKFGRVSVNPAAAERLLQYPEIVAVMNDPKIVAITNESADPSVKMDVLSVNRRLTEAFSDPALIAKMQKIDIEKALDFALKEPAPGSATP